MNNMTNTQKLYSHGIIHTASLGAAGIGGGLAQIPMADHAGLSLLQTGMISSLARLFGVPVTKAIDDITGSCLAATAAGQGITKLAIGWMPGAGNVICGVTAAGITEALGWAVAQEYSRVQHTPEEFSIQRVIAFFEKELPKMENLFH